MEFELDEVVFYMFDNKVHSAPVLSRMMVENVVPKVSTDEQRETLQAFGPNRIMYKTIHGVFNEDEIFHTKYDLLASL